MRLNDFNKDYLDCMRKPALNTIRLSGGSKRHQGLMLSVCAVLVDKGLPFYTECPLRVYGRADVVSPLTGEIIEIAVTETDVKAQMKAKAYMKNGQDLKLVFIRNEQDIMEWADESVKAQENG